MMNSKLISVIIPCYNAEKYIEKTLKCLIAQTYPNWECIIVDDGSTDGSTRIIKEFLEKDTRFNYYFQPNNGSASAKNYGLEKAMGSFIQFLDSDDILLKDKFELTINEFEKKTELDIIYSEYCFYSEGNGYYQTLPAKIPQTDTLYSFLFEWNIAFLIPIHSFIFRKGVFESIKFDSKLKSFAEDLRCWIQVAQNGFTFGYLEKVCAVYRQIDNSSTTKETTIINAKIVMTKEFIQDNRLSGYREYLDESLHYFNQRLVMALFMEKDFRRGLKLFISEIKYSSVKGIIKMLGWLFLMLVFNKNQIVKKRAFIVKHTPFKWGGWAYFREWHPPYQIEI